jgi:predicted PurR-regulated permease PerM
VSQSAPAPREVPRGLMILLGLAAATVVVLGLKTASGFLGPLILALILVIIVSPITGWLKRRGFPGWLAATVSIITVYLILIGMIVSLVVSAARLAEIVPAYVPQMNDLITQGAQRLADLGVDNEQIARITSSLDVNRVVSIVTSILSGLVSVLSGLFLVALLALFLAFDAAGFPRLLDRVAEQRPEVVAALRSFTSGTRRYFVVSAVFGLIVAVFDTIALEWIGIAGAVVWGILSFVTNFIPNVGFIIGLVPPAILGLLDQGWGGLIAVVVAYTVINTVIQTLIQPKIVGDSIGITASLAFISLLFWAWVLGALGALLAIPMTLLVKALFVDVDPNNQWMSPLISGKMSG